MDVTRARPARRTVVRILRLERALAATLDVCFPPRCLACEGDAWDGALPGLCGRCAGALPVILGGCPRCGREAGASGAISADRAMVGVGVVEVGCVVCRREATDLDGVVAPTRYRDLARDLVLSLKFHRRTPAAVPLGLLLADALRGARCPGDLVVPVPLSRARFRERGHNQADDLARIVASALDLDRCPKALVKARDTRPQSGLARGLRRRNPRGAFRARRSRVEGRCVLLIDDVVTTGATASACARALKRAGAARVVLAAACRA